MKLTTRAWTLICGAILVACAAAPPTNPTPAAATQSTAPLKERVIVNGVVQDERPVVKGRPGLRVAASPSPYSGFHWPRSSGSQAYVRVIYKAPMRWKAITDKAIAEWSKSSRLAFVYANSCPGVTPQRNCLWIREFTRDDNVIGEAVIWAGTHVSTPSSPNTKSAETGQTTVRFNSKYAATFANDPNLACHEIGHTIGLGHPLDGSQGPCINVPKAEDYSLVRSIYAHLDPAPAPPGV